MPFKIENVFKLYSLILDGSLRYQCSIYRELVVLVNFMGQIDQYWPRGYKTFFMLKSVEHEISKAHKYINIKKFNFFSGSGKPRMVFFLLMNVKMPTIVGILPFMSRKNFMLS